jgi:hypothetical protein
LLGGAKGKKAKCSAYCLVQLHTKKGQNFQSVCEREKRRRTRRRLFVEIALPTL